MAFMVSYGVAVHSQTNVGESAGLPELEGINDLEKRWCSENWRIAGPSRKDHDGESSE